MTRQPAAGGPRVASLDLLRGTAALVVATAHFFAYRHMAADAAETLSSLAVEVFFVLSGYVLAPQILFCLGEGRAGDLGVFLVRRWMRTIPPYLIALIAISVLDRQLGTADFIRYLFYAQNLTGQANDNDYFAIAWSLSIEEWFYIGFPSLLLLVAVLAGNRGRRLAALVGFAVCLAVALARLHWGDSADWGGGVRRVVAFRIDAICYGFLLYLAGKRLRSVSLWRIVIAFVAAATAGYWLLQRADSLGLAQTAFPFAAAAFGATAILLALGSERYIAARPRLARLGLYLGGVSYAVYLFHIILIELLDALLGGLPGAVLFGLFVFVLFGFATLFWRHVEQPILALRPRYRSGLTATRSSVQSSA